MDEEIATNKWCEHDNDHDPHYWIDIHLKAHYCAGHEVMGGN